MFRNMIIAILPLTVLFWGTPVLADADAGINECPVGLVVTGKTLDEEFGPGSQDLTRCLDKRKSVKLVMQINTLCGNSTCSRPYGLGNLSAMVKDYEITHGMVAGKDYEMAVVVHSGGGMMVLKDEGIDGYGDIVTGRNDFEGAVKGLIAKGVKFYFCQNTTRGMVRGNRLPDASEGGATAELIDGVEYVTAGLTAIGDFASRGYSYVQP